MPILTFMDSMYKASKLSTKLVYKLQRKLYNKNMKVEVIMMYNPKFIDLLEILENRQAQYEIIEDVFSMYLGNQLVEFSKFNEQRTLELIEEIIKYW